MSDGQERASGPEVDDRSPARTSRWDDVKHPIGVVLLSLALIGGFAWLGSYFHELSGAASYDVTARRGASQQAGEVSPQAGARLFNGRGSCLACHTMGDQGVGIRGPNLGVHPPDFTEPIGVRAASAQRGVTAVEHIVEALYAPDAYITPGFESGIMIRVSGPPTMLSDEDIRSIILFLFQQSGVPATPELEEEILTAQRAYSSSIADADAGEPEVGLSGNADHGRARFAELHCDGCHGAPDAGVPAPATSELAAGHAEVDLLVRIARHEREEPDAEPTLYGAALTVQDSADLAAFLTAEASDARAVAEEP